MLKNEELASRIQNGEKGLSLILWQNVERILYKKATVYYLANTDLCASHGVELNDLKSVCYLAFLDAVKSYKQERELTFTSYLDYPFQNVVNSLLGLRTSRQQNEPLNHAASLDKPIETADGDSSTLLDFIADETSIDFLEDVDRDSEAAFIRQIVAELQEPYRTVIQEYFFNGKSLQEISELLGVTPERVRQYKYKALRILRQNGQLRRMYKEQKTHEYMLQIMRWEHSPERFELVQQLNKMKLSYGYKQAELCAARERWIKMQEPEEQETEGYNRRRAALLSICP